LARTGRRRHCCTDAGGPVRPAMIDLICSLATHDS
jgi:hypothetical protein